MIYVFVLFSEQVLESLNFVLKIVDQAVLVFAPKKGLKNARGRK